MFERCGKGARMNLEPLVQTLGALTGDFQIIAHLQEMVRRKILELSPDGTQIRATADGLEAFERFARRQTDWEAFEVEGVTKIDGGEFLIEAGHKYTGQRIIKEIFEKARESLDIVDPYFGSDVLDRIVDSQSQAAVRAITSEQTRKYLTSSYVQAFVSNGRSLEIRIHQGKALHDRFVVVDHRLGYQIGGSLKDVGSRDMRISRADKPADLAGLFERRWKESTQY
jgi:hypothetical protein